MEIRRRDEYGEVVLCIVILLQEGGMGRKRGCPEI